MRNKGKWITLVLIVGLLATTMVPVSLAADTTYTWGNFYGWVPPTTLDTPVAKYLMNKTGVQFSDVFSVTSDADSQLLMRMAAGNLPDIITTTNYWDRLIANKSVMQLDKYYKDKKNYPGLASIPPAIVKRYTQTDGHIYYVPNGYFPNLDDYPQNMTTWGLYGWYVRPDLMQKTGTTQKMLTTTAGIETFLKKVKNLKDAQGRNYIPLSTGSVLSITAVESMWGIQAWNQTAKGWVPDYQMPGYKTAMAWLNKLYTQGLIDSEICTQKNDQYQAKATTGRYAMFVAQNSMMRDMTNLSGDAGQAYLDAAAKDPGYKDDHLNPMGWLAIPFPKAPGGKQVPCSFLNPFGGYGCGLNAKIKDPDKVMKVLDYLCTFEGSVVSLRGIPSNGEKVVGNTVMEDTEYQNAFWAGFPGTCKTEGLWYFCMQAGAMVQPDDKTPIFGGKTYVMAPVWNDDRRLIYDYLVRKKEKTVTMMPSWQWMQLPVDGAKTKYDAVQQDIRKNSEAKMLMAANATEFSSNYSQFINDMASRGHSADTIAEWNTTYKGFAKTPSGQVKLKMPKKLAGAIFNEPVEKNGVGIWYGSPSIN